MEHPLLKEFVARLGKTDCWNWQGSLSVAGYSRFGLKGHRMHRIAWQIFHNSEIPKELQIDHLCRNTKCVNPLHLELVTPRVNVLRNTGPTALNAKKIACPLGHPYDLKNTYVIKANGARRCLVCHYAYQKRYRDAKKAA